MEIVTESDRVFHQFVSPIGALGSSSKKAAKRSIEEPTEAAKFFDDWDHQTLWKCIVLVVKTEEK